MINGDLIFAHTFIRSLSLPHSMSTCCRSSSSWPPQNRSNCWQSPDRYWQRPERIPWLHLSCIWRKSNSSPFKCRFPGRFTRITLCTWPSRTAISGQWGGGGTVPDFPINILRHTIKCAVLYSVLYVQLSVRFNGIDWFITSDFETIRINYSIRGSSWADKRFRIVGVERNNKTRRRREIKSCPKLTQSPLISLPSAAAAVARVFRTTGRSCTRTSCTWN